MTDAPELLPCPFCGGEAEWKSGGPGCAFITCKSCPAETGDGSIPRIRVAWNTRADLHQQALDAAREEGRRRGLEEALSLTKRTEILGGQKYNYVRCEEIHALIDKPSDPVAEAKDLQGRK